MDFYSNSNNFTNSRTLNKSFAIAIFIHLILLLFSHNTDNNLGDKIIPIELLLSDTKAGIGNSNINQDISTKSSNNQYKNESKRTESKKFKDDLNNKFKSNNLSEFKIKQENIKSDSNIKKSISEDDQKKSFRSEKAEQLNKGNKGVVESEDAEKGSLQGKGKIRIACLKCISPRYPKSALRRGIEGSTIVKVWILKSGKVEKVELVKSSGNISIDRVAIKAASESTFYPINYITDFNMEYDLNIK